MDKEELEKLYSPSRWSHRFSPDEVIKQHVLSVNEGSERAKAELECQLGRIYGETEEQKFDIFGADTLPGDAPIFVYIHGGYWQQLGREVSSFMVRPLCKAGAVAIAIGYDLAPKASMPEMVGQCKKAIAYALNLASHRKSSGVYLCGHSAGSHLAAMMLSVDWMSECMLSNSLIKGALLVSGVYDLQPLVNTYVNDPIRMSQEVAWDNSPKKYINDIIRHSSKRQITIAVGQHDSPVFHQQSTDFEQELRKGGICTKYIEVPDTDHFNVIEDMQHENYILTKEMVSMMNLNLDGLIVCLSKTGC